MVSVWHWKHLAWTMSRPGCGAADCARAGAAETSAETSAMPSAATTSGYFMSNSLVPFLPGAKSSRSARATPRRMLHSALFGLRSDCARRRAHAIHEQLHRVRHHGLALGEAEQTVGRKI